MVQMENQPGDQAGGGSGARTGATRSITLGGGCFWCTEAVFLDVDAALFVDHRVSEEAGGDTLLDGRVGQEVAGELLNDEAVVGPIVVKRVDDPVAVGPD